MRSIYLEPAWLKHYSKSTQLNEVYVVEANALLRELILATYAKDITDDRVNLLVSLAILELVEAKDATTFLPMPRDERARIVANLALEDIACEKSFDQLCDDANASRRTITRLFNDETKLNFREWRQRARIMNAIELLETQSRSIKQIAMRLGFSSTASFAHAFKEIMGTTPSEFLNKSE